MSENDRPRRELRIFWLDAPKIGRIAVMPRPHPDAFPALRDARVDCIVSLLEPDEATDLGLADEAGLAQDHGMAFLHLPVPDHGVPESITPVRRMSIEIRRRLEGGEAVAVHCFAGLGRSPLLIAAVLIDCGMDTMEACDLISAARGHGVPEMSEQSDWLLEYERQQRGW